MSNIKVEKVAVAGIYHAITGMRNAHDSWDRSDTTFDSTCGGQPCIGPKDMKLAQTLIKAGSEHRKFMRQIQVWCNISVPRYIWQELDTYKFGTKNSCSTMHTLVKTPITMDYFYIGEDPIIMTDRAFVERIIPDLNYFRDLYIESKDYRWVKEMKRMLPESFIQMRTWNTNYEELYNIEQQRENHRMDEEWKVVLDFIADLPYYEELFLSRK